jgi:hypothetical protein
VQSHLRRILDASLELKLPVAERALAVVEEALRQGLCNPSEVRRDEYEAWSGSG